MLWNPWTEFILAAQRVWTWLTSGEVLAKPFADSSAGTGRDKENVMLLSRRFHLLIITTAASLAALILPVTALAGIGAAIRPFQLTKFTPQVVKITPNSTGPTITISWSGQRVFPIRAYVIPGAHCSTNTFTCGTFSHRFASGTTKLFWRNSLTCTGSLPGPITRHDYLYLVNAKGRYTIGLPLTFTCEY